MSADLRGARLASHFQKIPEHLVAAFCQDALGMKLHPFDRQGTVTQPHDHAAIRLSCMSCYRELRRQRILIDNERVIPRAGEWAWKSSKDAFAVVLDDACLAVHEMLCANDLSPKASPIA